MKFKFLAVGSLLGLSLVPVAYAQVNIGLKGNVPFDFHVGDRAFPAGNYLVRPTTSSPFVLSLRSLDQTTTAIMFLCSNRAASGSERETRLIFNRHGSVYFLSEVWQGLGHDVGLQLTPSKTERVVAHEMAATAKHHKTELASVVFSPLK